MSRRPAAGPPEAVLDAVTDGADLIVPLANGEPVSLLDVIEANATRFRGVRVHQMHALHDRPYIHGARPLVRAEVRHDSLVPVHCKGQWIRGFGAAAGPSGKAKAAPGLGRDLDGRSRAVKIVIGGRRAVSRLGWPR